MRVAIVHDLMNQMGGAERVLLTLHDLYPQAPIYTSIWDPRITDKRFRSLDIRTSFMQRLPFILRHHQPYLPLYPFAFERLDLREYDVIISSSWAFAKGIVTRPEALHICYCHTPMRWAWRYEDYVSLEDVGLLIARAVLPPFITWLRSWDYTTAGASRLLCRQLARGGRAHRQVLPPRGDRHHAAGGYHRAFSSHRARTTTSSWSRA